ncbi:MAG: SDR family oxidoreductase [Alphaproteobacteria bacterium]
MTGLDGKAVLVTGGSRGIGEAIARAMAKAGARVAVAARNIEACRSVAAEIVEAGGEAVALPLDLGDAASAQAAVGQTQAKLGGLDVLVNNAGTIDPIGGIDAVAPADWARCVAINLTGAYATTHHAFRAMRAGGGGRIVNISSGAARRPLEGWSAYCASKAGLAMLTRSTDLEGRAHGIRCFGYAPGVVDTAMQATIRASGVNEVSRIPRAALDPPDDAARLAVWLASGAADDLAAEALDIRDPALRARAGLAPR